MKGKNKEKKTRKCMQCNSFFIYRAWNQKYCSEKCSVASRYKDYTCVVCDTRFRSRHPNRKYCSNKCSAVINIKPAKTKELKCTNCRKKFIRNKSRIRGSKVGNFCTRGCWDEYNSRMRAENSHKWNSKLIKCEYCREEVPRQPNELKDRKRVYCSHMCYSYWLEENTKGENSPSWRGGTCDYRGDNWREISAYVRKRDNFRCRECGVPQADVLHDVHHIIPFRFFAGDWKKANKEENLITLCKSCHGKQESHWWHEVPEQYKQYM